VTVICSKVELDPADSKQHTALNPKLIVEVLSPSTEDYDRGEKLGNYKQIPSLLEVVLVAHDRPEVEVVRREADGSWSRHIARESGAVRLESIACELLVAEIYLDPLASR
jgi:Uma2 family endonuclease